MSSSSNIFVEVGQCGNQLGQTLLNHIYRHYVENKSFGELDIHFRQTMKSNFIARAVCIDTEPKVINNCLNNGLIAFNHPIIS